MKLFNVEAVGRLARQKADVLGIPYAPRPYPRGSGMERLHPARPPVVELEYTPPEGASTSDPPTDEIIFRGEFVDVNVNSHDACLLYQVSDSLPIPSTSLIAIYSWRKPILRTFWSPPNGSTLGPWRGER